MPQFQFDLTLLVSEFHARTQLYSLASILIAPPCHSAFQNPEKKADRDYGFKDDGYASIFCLDFGSFYYKRSPTVRRHAVGTTAYREKRAWYDLVGFVSSNLKLPGSSARSFSHSFRLIQRSIR